ncbi:ADP-ribosylglycohydrolase family protein [Oceanisphaera sp. IT1-181]|uniref:ADP-ribosylglycohydrolase family protein n=1 Tax=Oceanisphaera sp. IT1-181 TaxID=3081199 RepID=UPI0029CA53DF|nr:ADP-ribosylglycohydrolase family protein [Oceanisphaera sp. IT1-181]
MPNYHASPTTQTDRAAGAIMGAFIGDALGVGPHWYYDLAELRRKYGDWIDDYTTPKLGHYHEGLKAGEPSQSGVILRLTLVSLIAHQGYKQADFCQRLEQDLFTQLDFTKLDSSAKQGPGGYTSQSIRETWHKRVQLQLPWEKCAGTADNTEALERTLGIAVCYAGRPKLLNAAVCANTRLTQDDEMVLAHTLAFNGLLGLLIEGHALDAALSDKLLAQVDQGELPFCLPSATHADQELDLDDLSETNLSCADALLTPAFMANLAASSETRIEPAWRVSEAYGMACSIYQLVPAAYYLAARFSDDFESAVLHAINGGGHNMARAMLTGALVGAQVGLSGIPQRFIDGLANGEELVKLAKQVAEINTCEE